MPDNHRIYLNSDYLFYEIGVNLIPINSIIKRPKEEWKHWQNEPITKELYEQQKLNGDFNNGYAIITGNIWRGPYQGKYLVCIDIDNHEGLEEILTFYPDSNSIFDLATKTMIVQHEDAKDERAHIYFITSTSIPKRSGISGVNKNKHKALNVPAIEVKSDNSSCLVGPGSVHKNGDRYSIIGTKDIQVLNAEEAMKLNDVINRIYEKYSTSLQTFSSLEKSLIERTMQYIKDRTKCFDDYFPCKLENCKLKHIKNWMNLFVNYHNKEMINA